VGFFSVQVNINVISLRNKIFHLKFVPTLWH